MRCGWSTGGRLDRKMEIGGISFLWGWPPGIVLGRLKISNPEWAKTPSLVDAEGVYARVAVVYVALEDRRSALKWLQIAYDEHDAQLLWVPLDPQIGTLPKDERFMRIANQIGHKSVRQ